jgi:Uma2 family endonuclease
MSTVSKRLLTPQEYLARERAAPFRSEYYHGETFAMAGATKEHTGIKDNLAGETRLQLKGTGCRILTSDLRVKVEKSGLYTYPDAVVICGKGQFEDAVLDTLLNPRAIAEVLSESTEAYDRGDKFELYKQIPSLQEYILIAQDRPFVERHVRQPDGTWEKTEFKGLETTFVYASVPVQVPLAEIYRDVGFPDGAAQ